VLTNPFTPSEIAATPDQFFGRERELRGIEASLPVGSVLIQGPIGIGKSSLLARALDIMAGADCDARIVVADQEVQTAEAAARLVLDSLVDLQDERRGAFRLKFGLKFLSSVEPNIEVESRDAAKDQREGRYLAALKRILEADYRRRRASGRRLLILGIDEADKATVPITRLLRSIWTHGQQVGVPDVRFVIAGVSPLHQEMLREDRGVERAFNRIVTLAPMRDDETHELLVAKFTTVLEDAQQHDTALKLEPEVIDRIGGLSGGHPHVVQLLGSHIIQRENEHPDDVLSLTDLVGALHRVCYEDRRATYAATLHLMETAGKLPAFTTLLEYGLLEEGFPTRIFRQGAVDAVGSADLQWFVERDILVPRSADEYGLVDEFLRVRVAFDAEQEERRAAVEAELVQQGRLLSWDAIQEYISELLDTVPSCGTCRS
jgi:AAA ATPase domain